MARKGFTLIELLIVVVIIGLLAAISLPKLSGMKDRARRAQLITDLRNIMTAQEAYFETFGIYADSPGNLTASTMPSITTELDLWESSNKGFTFKARARLKDRPEMRCGVYVGVSIGQPSVPGIGIVTENMITCSW